jgi:hypothetical protein
MNRIEKFKDWCFKYFNLKTKYLKESSDYEYGCLMVEIPIDNWTEIIKSIDTKDLYTEINDDSYGIQKHPHLTLLYPILNNVKYPEIENILKGLVSDKITIKISKIDIFENEKFDVVKFNVEIDDYLLKIHDYLKSNISNIDKYDRYKPHITIAYVNSGKGSKYVTDSYNLTFESDTIVYTESNGNKNFYKISN